MPHYSERSLAHYATLSFNLQRICDEAIKVIDHAIICGHREKEAQMKAYLAGVSKLQWPDSKHNPIPSEAVDVEPCPEDWKNRELFCYQAGVFIGIAHMLGIPLRWGGNWDGDDKIGEKGETDLVHFELIQKGDSHGGN